MCRRRMFVAALMVLVGCVAAVSVRGGTPSAPAKTDSREGFTVHEWGTLSTFSGSNGTYLKFYPDDRDLPGFVHSRHRHIKGGLPDVFVSLETPVLYFYTDRELTASVRVDFPKGRMTEWYPQASRPPINGLVWEDIKVSPRSRASLPSEAGKSRYYAARETDASFVRVAADKDKSEYEKFLFYRGVGDFTMPLSVRALGNGEFTVRNSAKEAMAAFLLVRVQNGKVRFKTVAHLSAGAEATVRESAQDSTTEKLGAALVELLMREGLYEKEARAMVKTWSSDWFGEEGTRILYLVPASVTDELLPLRIAPRPSAQVRVLVGRHDILTPEREGDIDLLVKKLEGPSNTKSRAADEAMNRLGRYREPAQNAARARLKLQKEPRPARR
jgi:hypothetical protein